MKSKIELRLEAARIASSLKGVNIKNFCESVAVVEKYLSGCSDLPEVYNEADQIATVMKEMVSTLENKEFDILPSLKERDSGVTESSLRRRSYAPSPQS